MINIDKLHKLRPIYMKKYCVCDNLLISSLCLGIGALDQRLNTCIHLQVVWMFVKYFVGEILTATNVKTSLYPLSS